jgi:cytochrome oxidase Cu insertion factor (SCO1/SenC/PrrC family)
MRVSAAVLFFISFFPWLNAQEGSSAKSPDVVGLPVGQKAPAFSIRDQFGHEQSNETLKGANGTVLLFFRSADW